MHLGGSYQYRTGNVANDSGLPGTPYAALPGGAVNPLNYVNIVRFRARGDQRDAISGLGGLPVTGGTFGDGARFVDTGNIQCNGVNTVNGEFLAYWGPFWVQSEATAVAVENAVYPVNAAQNKRGTANFWGCYGMAGVLLTGENRGYDRRFGRYDRVVPNENFFLVKDENGCFCHGCGAWELVYRYDYINLDDKDAEILGGIMSQNCVGLNWYWNPNAKVQFEYLVINRHVPTPGVSGTVQGFGIRCHYDF